MQIGTIQLGDRPVLLAPMEDVSDVGFRLLCRRLGAAMVYSEFVAADALVRNVKKSLDKLRIVDDERPVAIQIYGRLPEALRDAAQIVEEVAHPDLIDLNFGCPVKRVAGKGAGAGLLKTPELMLEIARTVVDAVKTPVSAKTRLGWDHDNIIIETLAEQLQDTGLQALTIHGRTRAQMYKGEADWEPIRRVKQNPRIHIPIIGNGDLQSGRDVANAFAHSGVDACMVGRATFGRPWIFKEIYDTLHPDAPLSVPNFESAYAPMTADWKLDILKAQIAESIGRIDERRGILHIRRHLAATPLFKNIPNFRDKRIALLRAETQAELFQMIEDVRPLVREYSENTTL